MFGDKNNTKPAVKQRDKIALYALQTRHGRRQEIISSRIEATPLKYRDGYARALNGEATQKQVITAKCRECVGFENTSERVSNCESYGCPLWLYRPRTDT